MPAPIKLFSSNPSSSRPAKPAPAPLPKSFSEAQAKKAVDALLVHHEKVTAEKEEKELLPREEHVWLVVNTHRGSTRKSMKPVRVQLPHPPLPAPPATSVCLLSKAPQREYKDLIASHGIKFISRVVGEEKLKGKFKPFEARRELMRDHEIFLCDERILEKMPKLLGKMFFEAKKQPIAVNVNRKDLKAELGRAIASTYFHPSTGTSYAIRIATPSAATPAQTLANLLAAIPTVVSNIPEGWENVLSIGVKTNSSLMLPIWSSKLTGRFAAPDNKADVEMAAAEPQQASESESEAEPAAAPAPTPKKKKTKATSAAAVPEKKKSSTIGSGSVSKRAKGDVVGTPKAKTKAQKVVKKSKA
ncbi:hypothetical protein IAU60_001253 [Kwoniella sp. DSM 27419]